MDLWAHRGVATTAGSNDSRVKQEHAEVARTERRAREFEQRIRINRPTVALPGGRGASARNVKQERWDEDDRKEGRGLTRVSRSLQLDMN